MHRKQSRVWRMVGGAVVAMAVVSGCQSGGSENVSGATGDPLTDLENAKLAPKRRVEAVRAAWEEAASPDASATTQSLTRERLKALVWKGSTPEDVKVAALESLLSDTTEAGKADNRNFIRLRLASETTWSIVERMSAAAGDGGWTEATAGLVRSWSRKVPNPTDEGRPEKAALEKIHAGKPAIESVFAVYLDPEANGSGKGDFADKARAAAWDLLGRLDPDGSKRAAMLANTAPAATGEASAELALVQRTARELRVVPVTGSELLWARGLFSKDDPAAAKWVSEVGAVTAGLGAEQLEGLQLRHLEPLRWASANRREWLGASRSALMSELESRLATRKVHARQANVDDEWGKHSETLKQWGEKMSWGDVLTVLVIDDAVRDPALAKAIFAQVEVDRADTSTERGGAIFAPDQPAPGVKAGAAPAFAAVDFPPRPAQRFGDKRFVASDDMFRHSGRSLCHYHFHVQEAKNADYAGPGDGDMEYAETHGRACIVFTSINDRTLNVDYYQRGGARLDLGEISR